MNQLTFRQYDALESAIVHARRVAIFRRGTEYIVIPQRLRTSEAREVVDVLHPTTGEEMTLFLDEIERLDVVAT